MSSSDLAIPLAQWPEALSMLLRAAGLNSFSWRNSIHCAPGPTGPVPPPAGDTGRLPRGGCGEAGLCMWGCPQGGWLRAGAAEAPACGVRTVGLGATRRPSVRFRASPAVTAAAPITLPPAATGSLSSRPCQDAGPGGPGLPSGSLSYGRGRGGADVRDRRARVDVLRRSHRKTAIPPPRVGGKAGRVRSRQRRGCGSPPRDHHAAVERRGAARRG